MKTGTTGPGTSEFEEKLTSPPPCLGSPSGRRTHGHLPCSGRRGAGHPVLGLPAFRRPLDARASGQFWATMCILRSSDAT